MTTTLQITHTTGFSYSSSVTDSFNEIRMSPLYTPQQLIRERQLKIEPKPWSYSYIDYWGTNVTAFELHEPHDRLTVTVNTCVDVDSIPARRTQLRLDEVGRYSDRWNEYLELTPAVSPGEDLGDRVVEIAAGGGQVDEIALAVGTLIHEEMNYESGSTEVTARAQEAWDSRKGVCQDFSHLMIGALRLLGIPARYVSGYILPDSQAAVGEPVRGESHAWVQWFNGDWFSYDPTNDLVPGELHVMVGQGREYSDVAPLRGMFTGQARSGMFVSVEMTRLS
ncbi:transglutaminase family protein [Corynebacterium pacaense]|uniref:transglutaminase family protein n=1 Tax=Corynebacterium pacaense TaxID=1816684 RepID=UPI0009BC254C|nr:transglutaminase family protein [Corynebacterium pacaense]